MFVSQFYLKKMRQIVKINIWTYYFPFQDHWSCGTEIINDYPTKLNIIMKNGSYITIMMSLIRALKILLVQIN
jgi:hypothetical protein